MWLFIATNMANSPTSAIYGITIILNMRTPAGAILLNDNSQVLSTANQATFASSNLIYFTNIFSFTPYPLRIRHGPELVSKPEHGKCRCIMYTTCSIMSVRQKCPAFLNFLEPVDSSCRCNLLVAQV